MVAFPDIPQVLLPADGRFGSGPSKVRAAQLEALSSPLLMGTSHRAGPVREVVASLKNGLRSLLAIPDDYEVVLGNGGA
ncbi:MAG: phosphoserine transaminase, partial [Schaalia odontolytica]